MASATITTTRTSAGRDNAGITTGGAGTGDADDAGDVADGSVVSVVTVDATAWEMGRITRG